MSDTASTILVSPDGRQFDVPANGVSALKEKGFRDLNQAEITENLNREKFGTGILPPIAAGVAGLARTASFGLSDVAGEKLGIGEDLQQLKEKQPIASTIGEVGGAFLPVVGELAGATAAGKVAAVAGTAVKGVGKVAGAIGEGAASLLPQAIKPLAKGAITAGIEGAAFQAGANVGESARRNIPLDAETFLAHTGEAAILGAGIGAALPAANAVAKWTVGKALDGLEAGVQALRAAGFKGASLGVDAIESGLNTVSSHSEAIGEGIANATRSVADLADQGLGAVAGQADNIGTAVEGISQNAVSAVDEELLPKIRTGLMEQTKRPDIINDVFANTPQARALRQELGQETLTGARIQQSEALGKAVNQVWDASLQNKPMFDDIAIALKRDLQSAELQSLPMTAQEARSEATKILQRATSTHEQLAKFSPDAAKIFDEAIRDFSETALNHPSAETLYHGLDQFKSATQSISNFAKGAIGDMSIGSGKASQIAREFGSTVRLMLEDSEHFGGAAVLQREVNSAYSRYQRAFDTFEKQFAAAKAKGQPASVLDGAKVRKWSRDIANQSGDVRNATIDELVESQQELIQLTDELSKRAQQNARDAFKTIGTAPGDVDAVLKQGQETAQHLSAAKSAAHQILDRAEVLQGTQNAILSRQGAGVNPLPVELAKQLGAGTLVGGAIGGVPGAIIGGSLTSILQKYGAITSNPKSAIEFLNHIDRLRGASKQSVSSWVRDTIGESNSYGLRGRMRSAAEKVDSKSIAESIKLGADRAAELAEPARLAIDKANKATARRILDARHSVDSAISAVSKGIDNTTPELMKRILPGISYMDVNNGNPGEWWRRTQTALTKAQSDPRTLLDESEREVEGISSDLPELAHEISQQKLRVLGYLADKMPRDPRPFMLGVRKWEPTPSQLKDFRDLTLVATNPNALLPLISLGTATQAQADAVRELWPQTFAQTKNIIVSAVMDAAANSKPLPYQARIRIGRLLRIPMDPSQEPGFSQWLDTTLQSSGEVTQPQQSPTSGLSAPLQIDTSTMLSQTARLQQH